MISYSGQRCNEHTFSSLLSHLRLIFPTSFACVLISFDSGVFMRDFSSDKIKLLRAVSGTGTTRAVLAPLPL